MKAQQQMEERLWEYIDGIASAAEKTVIEQLLESDAAWQAKYSELLEVQALMQSAALEEPSLRFTKNVMEEIARQQIAPATKNYINKHIIRGITLFFFILVAGFLVYGFGQMDWTTGGDSKLPVDISKLDFSRFFNNTWVNVFMMINIILGLFLLDNYLSDKRKKYRQEG